MENKNQPIKPQNNCKILQENPANAQIIAAASSMLFQVRIASTLLYWVAYIPLVLVFIVPSAYTFICSCVSLLINVLSQVLSSTMNTHKEKAIIVLQLYEANISNTTYARIEYDRETTNEANEYAKRKAINFDIDKYKNYYSIPADMPNKYTYLYTQRSRIAEDRYLLGKTRIFYAVMMFCIAVGVSAAIVVLQLLDSTKTIKDIIPPLVSLYPVLIPVVLKFSEAGTSSKRAVKISADIDNFFADHDKSSVRLERFNYYIQALMYEYRTKLIPIPSILKVFNKKKLANLRFGCLQRFVQSYKDLEGFKIFGKPLNGGYNNVVLKAIDENGEEYIPGQSDKDPENLRFVVSRPINKPIKKQDKKVAKKEEKKNNKQPDKNPSNNKDVKNNKSKPEEKVVSKPKAPANNKKDDAKKTSKDNKNQDKKPAKKDDKKDQKNKSKSKK